MQDPNFQVVQELQGVKPYDDEVAVAEKVVEDHWGPWLLKNKNPSKLDSSREVLSGEGETLEGGQWTWEDDGGG